MSEAGVAAQGQTPHDAGERAGIASVGVVGAGFMGSGIAESCAVAGLAVRVHDIAPDRLERSRASIEASLRRAVERGKVEREAADRALGRLTFTERLEQVCDAELIVEAVSEDLGVKLAVMRRVGELLADDAIVASNTSSIPIASLAAAFDDRSRVLGLHFFSPVPVMGLVEVVRALDTSEGTVEKALRFVEGLGKRPIVTRDRSGFVVNMLLVPYLVAAVRMYDEGFATREDIDAGMRLGCGHPMGPLALCDLIGLDVIYAVCESLFDEFKRDEYAPPPLIKRMVASGRLGRKTGRGFYEYDDGGLGAAGSR